jgi:hypothetical protein
VLVDVTKKERDVLLRWKKRSDSFVLVLKVGAGGEHVT